MLHEVTLSITENSSADFHKEMSQEKASIQDFSPQCETLFRCFQENSTHVAYEIGKVLKG